MAINTAKLLAGDAIQALNHKDLNGALEHLKLIDQHFRQTLVKNSLLQADKSRIAEVISNLLTNAIKFTSQGTIAISVEIDKTNKNDNKNWVIVSVKDTGQGIDVSILSSLFTKFASKSYHGTGLGLYISKGIMEAHGGKIWGENNPDGRGATFSFSLPI
jgi:signal transduction histidine kinase